MLIEINILLQDAAGAQGGLEETLSDLRRLISDDFVSCYRGLEVKLLVLCQYL